MTEQEKDELFADAKKVLKQFGIVGIDSWEELDQWRRWENDDIPLERRISKALCELNM